MSSQPDLEAQPTGDEQGCITESFSFAKNHKILTMTLVVAAATGAVFVAKLSVDDEASKQHLDDTTNAGEVASMVLGAAAAIVEKVLDKNVRTNSSATRQAAMQAFQAPAVNVEGDDPVEDGESYYDYIARWFNRADSEE